MFWINFLFQVLDLIYLRFFDLVFFKIGFEKNFESDLVFVNLRNFAFLCFCFIGFYGFRGQCFSVNRNLCFTV